jgi:hypothetical protein
LQLKAQALDVSDYQVITQAIKPSLKRQTSAQSSSQGMSENSPGTLQQFTKFSKLEVSHFHKLEQQRKAPNQSEASKPPRYSDN